MFKVELPRTCSELEKMSSQIVMFRNLGTSISVTLVLFDMSTSVLYSSSRRWNISVMLAGSVMLSIVAYWKFESKSQKYVTDNQLIFASSAVFCKLNHTL